MLHEDHFFGWLTAGVAGFCDHQNLRAMSEAVERMPSTGAVIEIGSFMGRSTCFLSRLLELSHKPNEFFSVDDWFYEGFTAGVMITDTLSHDGWRELNEKVFRLNMEYLAARKPAHIKLRSDDFFNAWDKQKLAYNALTGERVLLGGPIAFAFIDGDHTYAQCRRDFENIDRHLVPGGFILFDDSAEDVDFGSVKVAAEVAESRRYEMVGRFPNVMVRRRQ